MESVESPLEVLSRAATMVQHCRAYRTPRDNEVGSPLEGSAAPPPAAPSPAAAEEEEEEDEEVRGGAPPPLASAPSVTRQPSSKWRRDRRSVNRIPDYKNRESSATGNKALRSQSFNDKSLISPVQNGRLVPQGGLRRSEGDLSQLNHDTDDNSGSDTDNGLARKAVPLASLKGQPPEYTESPLDMSVRVLPPPSYSQAISSALYRPSVITQAPCNTSTNTTTEYVPGSMSMCDPVIDEHFRRSLGADYMSLFNKTKDTSSATAGKAAKVVTKDRGSSPIMFASDPCSKFLNSTSKSPNPVQKSPNSIQKSPNSMQNSPNPVQTSPVATPKAPEESVDSEDSKMEVDECAGLSVDDHFAKALGDTWKKLQEKTDGKIVSKTELKTTNGDQNKSNDYRISFGAK